MNNRENALKLRVRKLEMERAAQKLTIDRLVSDLEMTESVGCGFAWDLAETMSDSEVPVVKAMLMEWDTALQAGADFQEARKWLRDQVKTNATFRKTATEAAGKDPNMELETPFGRYSLRTLSAT
jgi:hypothetical protein